MASVLSVASTREAAAEDVFLPLPEGMIIGEKGAFAHESTGSACLDFFFGVVPTVPYLRFNELLAAAWEEDAGLALRLVFQTGSVRRGSGGKQDRHNYYRGLMWLFDYQEATFFANVKEIHKHTSLKCLLNILMFATHRDGPLSLEGFFQSAAAHRAHRVEIRMPLKKKSRRRERRQRQIKLREMFAREQNAESFMALRCSRGGEPVSNPLPTTRPWAGTQFIRKELDGAWSKFVELKQREFTEAAKATKRTRVAPPPQDGSPLSRLYVAVAEIFAQGLREEMHAFSVGLQVPGLFAKWAPTAGGMHDKGTGIVQGIATLLSGNGPLPACENYMRNYVRPLRAAAQLPEHYLGKRAFDRVNYERMPSRCRLLYGAVYKKWDPVGYNAHLELCRQRVLSGDTSKGPSVKVDALLPHEVTAAAEKDPESVEPNLQWREMVQRCASGMESTGLFIPVCDVSGSMSGTPMEVAIALSLLLCEAQARESVFFGKVITFHEEPHMVQVQDIPEKNELGNLADRVAQVRGIEWGMSTDIEQVFTRIMEAAVNRRVDPTVIAQMSVVVFSDMEFNAALETDVPWETAHEGIVRMFRDAGYPQPPQLVYWNLRDSPSKPVGDPHMPGVVLLAGFSASLMEAFLAGRLEEFTPRAQMLALLQREVYAALRVAAEN